MTQEESLRRLQAEELEILLAVSELCERNGIEWFLMSGTALGAARHSGFIPWDDDIDIGMLREDYDRFLSIAREGLPAGFSLHTCENTPGFAGFFAKVYRDGTLFLTDETIDAGCKQGIFVDVFPFDRVEAEGAACARRLRRAMTWQWLSYLYHSGYITVPHHGALGTLERLACRVAHPLVRAVFSPKMIRSRFERLVERGPMGAGESARYVCLATPYTEPVAKELLVPVSTASFEGYELPVPGRLEEYLTVWYGDWRALPAPEDRHTHLPRRVVFSDGAEWSDD